MICHIYIFHTLGSKIKIGVKLTEYKKNDDKSFQNEMNFYYREFSNKFEWVKT